MPAAILAAGVMGCSAGDGDSVPSAVVVATISPGDVIQLPADIYLLLGTDYARFQNTRDRLVADCMAEAGFDYPTFDHAAGLLVSNDRRYGISDPELAAQYGYGVAPLPVAVKEQLQAVNDFEASLTASSELALFGVESEFADGRLYSEGSCLGLADEQLHALTLGADILIVDELFADAHRRFQGDPRLADLNEEWSECMNTAGYSYSDPLAAADDPAFAPPDGEDHVASAGERAVALADLDCKWSTDYLTVAVSIEAAYQLEVIDRHGEMLAEIAERIKVIRSTVLAETPG